MITMPIPAASGCAAGEAVVKAKMMVKADVNLMRKV
jgi:hypothetical protein